MPQLRRRLLVVTRHCPFPQNDGASAYLFDLLAYLKRGGTEIDLLWFEPARAGFRQGWFIVPRAFDRVARLHLPGSIALLRLRWFPAVWWLPWKARSLHAAKWLLCLVPCFRRRFARRSPRPGRHSGGAPAWSALVSPAETALFRDVWARLRPDGVLANYCWLAPLLDHAPDTRKLVLTNDVASQRLPLTGAARADLPAATNPAFPSGEAALLDRAEVILAITDADAAVFRSMLPAKTVLVAPKSAPALPRSGAHPVTGRCLFVGGRNPPNEEGLRWFLAEIWPQVLRARPDAHLHVCGAVGAVLGERVPQVTVRGRLADLAPEYAAAEVVIVPLRRGTGMNIKLVEAAAHGKACVTTPVGLQGAPFFRDATLCASEAAEFAAQVLGVLNDATWRDELGDKLRAAARRHLSPENTYGAVERWLQAETPARTWNTRPAVAAGC